MIRTKAYFFKTDDSVSYYSKFRLEKKSIETVYRDLLDSVVFKGDAGGILPKHAYTHEIGGNDQIDIDGGTFL